MTPDHVGRSRKPSVAVLGGVVSDLVFSGIEQMPDWSAAVQAAHFEILAGGKGLNQAVAAASLGATVSMIGAVGDDHRGGELVDKLQAHSVSTDFLFKIPRTTTPAVALFVNSSGDVAFIGWKNRLSKERVQKASPRIAEADVLMVTLEVGIDAAREAINIAKKSDVRVMLNPAPPPDRDELPGVLQLLGNVDVLVPNYVEAATLLRKLGPGHNPSELARELCERGVDTACVTNSQMGCMVATNGDVHEYAGFPSLAVDTTGGSDAFCAALAISLCEGRRLDESIRRANAAGAMAVTTPGGSPSMPTASGLDKFLRDEKRKKMGARR